MLFIGHRKNGVNAYQTHPLPRKPELLAPGGSYEKARIAYLYGADAVYAGTKELNLRIQAKNLDDEQLAALSFYAHRSDKRLYVTVNTLLRSEDLKLLPPILEYLEQIQVHGIIIADPALIDLAGRYAPHVPLHLSTQVSTTNPLAVRFWGRQGIHRINLARELSLQDIVAIRAQTEMQIEVFVHGSMCVSYSGRCLLSSVMSQRSANRGHCAQPCRWAYGLVEERRPGEIFPILQDSRGSYILNSKDLCLLAHLPTLIELGVDALKIEGRMKGVLYVAGVVRGYRRAIDRFILKEGALHPDDLSWTDVQAVSHRPYTSGFFTPDESQERCSVSPSTSLIQTHTLAGIVRALPPFFEGSPFLHSSESSIVHDWTYIEARSPLQAGSRLQFLFPDGRTTEHVITVMEDLNGRSVPVAHPNTCFRLPLPFPTFPLQVIRLPLTP